MNKTDIRDLKELSEKCIKEYNVTEEKIITKSKLKGFILIFTKDREGFIVGYEDIKDSECLFVWLFGVLEKNRKKGIGLELLKKFGLFAKMRGYKYVRSYTYNKFKGKLILSLKNGYEIIGFEDGGRILIEKKLNE